MPFERPDDEDRGRRDNARPRTRDSDPLTSGSKRPPDDGGEERTPTASMREDRTLETRCGDDIGDQIELWI